MIKVFLVILNWNRTGDTVACITSVSKLRVSGYELNVLVVDNDSNDNSPSEITRAVKHETQRRINFILIKNKSNLGFAGGNNVGLHYALDHGADYVMILNNDTIVDENLIIHLIKVAKESPQAALISPKIYFAPGFEFHKDRYKKEETGKIIWYAGGRIDWDNIYGTNRGVDEIDTGQYEEVVDTDVATGSCMFCRSEALKKVGIFDEKYFMYYEDTDLSQRMKKAGWKVIYSPKGHLWHKVSQSSGIGSDLNDYFITRNRLLFGMRYASLRTRFALYRESLKFLINGREWQKKGVIDFYFGRFGKGSWRGN